MSEKQTFPFIPYTRERLSDEEMVSRSKDYLDFMDERRTVRDFSEDPVPREVLENIIMAASTAPSGAHKQPWTFCLLDKIELRTRLRALAEEEEHKSYHGRMSEQWLKDLAPLGTDWNKPFIEEAPWIIVVFKRVYEYDEENAKRNNYYVNESVGLACGFLLAAIHHAGLVALTHTPSPMNFLSKALDRPENERPYLLIPVGHPKDDATVPELYRKPLEKVAVYYGE